MAFFNFDINNEEKSLQGKLRVFCLLMLIDLVLLKVFCYLIYFSCDFLYVKIRQFIH